MTISSSAIERITITDCGSTTTKAILIEKENGTFRQTARGDAPTTVEAPKQDITKGIAAAVTGISRMRELPLIDDEGALIRPASHDKGQDLYLSTSSAGGGLQMVVAGLVNNISAKAALNAALGAGAIVTEIIAFDDEIPIYQQINHLRSARPDMVLLAGGTDGGATLPVLEVAELLAKANPKPRFGEAFKLPVIFAGNDRLQKEISAVLDRKFALFVEKNVLKNADEENLAPARERVHKLFLEHVMQQAPGFSSLAGWTDAPVMPTPSAVAEMLLRVSKRRGDNLLLVDIGGATTDIFSTMNGRLTRTVSANLGMSYSATEVLIQAGVSKIGRWLPDISEEALIDLIMNKTIRPTTIPDTQTELAIEQALAREAMRLAFEQHIRFAGSEHRGIADPFGKQTGQQVVNPMSIDTIIGSGGVISHAPDPRQSAVMLIDAFRPEGITRLAKDAIFMMPHLGVLSRILPDAADAVFESDCLTPLGACIAPTGRIKKGRKALSYAYRDTAGRARSGRLLGGEIELIPLCGEESIDMEIIPAFGVDVGHGPGKRWRGSLSGGPAGIILDGRGRPSFLEQRTLRDCWRPLLNGDSDG